MKNVMSAIKQNKNLDDLTAKDRLKRKRIKAKAKLRKAEGIPEKEAPMLGSGEDSNQ